MKPAEWIAYNKPWREFHDADLATVGTVVIIGEAEILIGEMNESGGVCDCCRHEALDAPKNKVAIVLKYKPPPSGDK